MSGSERKRRQRSLAALLMASTLVVMLGLLSGCARDYVSGQPTLAMMSEEEEVALGKGYDAQIVAEYGLYDDPELAAYVEELGQSLAAVSQRSHLDYHFRVLDDGVVNAFALPGGYIYMPRGILAFFNSEDELVGVLGHETGHVVARHGVEQMSQRVLFTGFGLTDRLAARFPVIGGLATAPINLGLLKYSRDQESESDRLGVEYATRTGHDAHAMAEFFKTLGEMSAQSDHEIPTYLSTHPHPEDRYERVNQLADEWQAKIDYTPRAADPGGYLKLIDGIVYGRDPRLGFVGDGIFYHPALAFQFPVPTDWKLANYATRVLMVAPDEKALVQMTLVDETSAANAVSAFLASEELDLIARREDRVNGLPIVELESAHTEGRQRTMVLSRFVEHGGKVLAFHALAGDRDYPTRSRDFARLLDGVAPITERAILDVQPLRVQVVRAPAAGDLATVLAGLDVAADDLQEIANLNGRALQDRVEQGDWLKIVR